MQSRKFLIKKWTFKLVYISVTIFSAPCHGVQEVVSENSKVAFKLTPSYYLLSDNSDAIDLNLRGSIGKNTAWIGLYQNKTNYQQIRSGYEYRFDYEFVRPVWSAQLASGGFFGGSVNAEVGGDNYGIVGFGRTNLKDYYNLNFDPNDAITLGMGSRFLEKTELSLFHIWDDRLDTQQQVTHMVLGYKPSEIEHLTIDSSYKQGIADNGDYIKGYAISVYYGLGNYFTRIAWDQYANFSSNTQTRFSLGIRF